MNFTKEQWAEVLEHLEAIQESQKAMRADIKEINACFDRIDAMFATWPKPTEH